jgi:hypothetical protein
MNMCLAFGVVAVVDFVLLHWDLCLTVLGFLLYAIKSTRWGKANAHALLVVTGAIERLDRADVKHAVRTHSLDVPKAVADAINDAVRTVDLKKPTPTVGELVVRETTGRHRRKNASKE